jgi:hypothetical protein
VIRLRGLENTIRIERNVGYRTQTSFGRVQRSPDRLQIVSVTLFSSPFLFVICTVSSVVPILRQVKMAEWVIICFCGNAGNLNKVSFILWTRFLRRVVYGLYLETLLCSLTVWNLCLCCYCQHKLDYVDL